MAVACAPSHPGSTANSNSCALSRPEGIDPTGRAESSESLIVTALRFDDITKRKRGGGSEEKDAMPVLVTRRTGQDGGEQSACVWSQESWRRLQRSRGRRGRVDRGLTGEVCVRGGAEVWRGTTGRSCWLDRGVQGRRWGGMQPRGCREMGSLAAPLLWRYFSVGSSESSTTQTPPPTPRAAPRCDLRIDLAVHATFPTRVGPYSVEFPRPPVHVSAHNETPAAVCADYRRPTPDGRSAPSSSSIWKKHRNLPIGGHADQ